MLEIYELHIFLAAAETGSFSEAGRRLQMSQPAVSMQIRSLENRLNVELFCRAGRHIRLTETGTALIPMARELIDLSIHIEEAIASLHGEVTGLLKLACSTTAGKYVLPHLIAGFIEQYPHVQVDCDVGSRGTAINKLLDGSAQLAITSLQEPYRELEFRPFILDPVVLITPPEHPWATRAAISVDELREGRFIVREPNSGTQQAVVEALARHHLGVTDLQVVMTLGSSEAIHLAVTEGIGVAFVSQRAATDGIYMKRAALVPVEGLDIVQQLYMARHTDRAATSAQNAFWEYVALPENQAFLQGSPVKHAGF